MFRPVCALREWDWSERIIISRHISIMPAMSGQMLEAIIKGAFGVIIEVLLI